MIAEETVRPMLARLAEIEAQLADPATAARPDRLRQLLREHAALRRLSQKAERYFQLCRDAREHRDLIDAPGSDPDLAALAREELGAIERQLPAAEKALLVALIPPDPSESRSAIVEIRAGTGGEEAALFAADLFRMYSRHAEDSGWKVSVIDASPSEIGGYKEIIFSVAGENVYGRLQFESGGHRVQRVPATESQGRIHTSAATVAVFPEAEPEDDVAISPEDLRVDIFRSSGPGGQSVNTTDSAVRITHLPTGIMVRCQEEKSQHRNRERALSLLKARLLDAKRRAEEAKMGSRRRSLIGSGDRSEKIRTYNFPQNRLTDHRINLTLYDLDRIVEGHLSEVLDALRENDQDWRLQQLTQSRADASG
jgi:peptide chain release factor 1